MEKREFSGKDRMVRTLVAAVLILITVMILYQL